MKMVEYQIVSKEVVQVNCLACSNTMSYPKDNKTIKVQCDACQKEYPIVKGIPILLKDPISFLSETALLLNKHIKSSLSNRDEIKKDSETNILRRNALKNLARAIEVNTNLVKDIVQAITPFITVENLLDRAILSTESRSYGFDLKDYRYLRRDWAWLPKSEEQVKIIKDTLATIIQKYDDQLSTALVLGAGVGRFACDVASLFQRVHAFDRSFSMAYFFKRTLEEDILFYELNVTNIMNSRNMARLLRASIRPPANGEASEEHLQNANKVNYFVGDAMQIPLADAAVSTVVSAYFTDVLALKLFLKEVKRVLQTNGIFVHFGPFDYPFHNVAEKLGTNEIKTIFIQNGFEILEDRFVPCHHVESSIAHIRYTYRNWVFVARKKEEPEIPSAELLTEEAVVSIKNKVAFVNAGYLSNEGMTESAKLVLENGMEILGAEPIISVLDFVDGERTVKEIIQALANEFDMDEGTQKMIFEKIKDLIEYRVLEVL